MHAHKPAGVTDVGGACRPRAARKRSEMRADEVGGVCRHAAARVQPAALASPSITGEFKTAKALRAYNTAATRHANPPGQEWVVDTGASRHVCPPSAATNGIRNSDIRVETANGVVKAIGETSIFVPSLGRTVAAVVLPGTPRLLSAGALVSAGYELEWSEKTCAITPPGGTPIQLSVRGGVPVLAARAGHHAAPATPAATAPGQQSRPTETQ